MNLSAYMQMTVTPLADYTPAAELHGYRVELSDGCKVDGPLTSNIRVCTGDTVRLHLNHYAG